MVPLLVDGDLALFESFAINHYLAEKSGGELAPQDAQERAQIEQWGLYGTSAIEPLALDIMWTYVKGRAQSEAIAIGRLTRRDERAEVHRAPAAGEEWLRVGDVGAKLVS